MRPLRPVAALSIGVAALIVSGAPVRGHASGPGAPPNVEVSRDSGQDWQQPSLAMDPARPNHLAVAYQQGGARRVCALALSPDGGRTWTARVLIGTGGDVPVPEGYAACWNPSVTYGAAGTLYYLFQTSLQPSNPYSHVLVAVSRDGGHSFDGPHTVDPSSPTYPGMRAGGDWWPQMAADHRSGALYVTWSRFTPELDSSWIKLATSHDGGATFSAPITVSGALEHDVTGPRAAVQADGTLYVDWVDYTEWERGLVACNPNGGACYDWGASSFGHTTEQNEQLLMDFYHDEGPRLDFTQGLGCEDFVSPTLLMPGNIWDEVERGGSCAAGATVRAAQSSDGGRSAEEVSPPGEAVSLGCAVEYGRQLPPRPPNHVCSPTHYSNYDHNLLSTAAAAPGGELVAWWDSEGPEAVAPARVSVAYSASNGERWNVRTPVGVDGQAARMQHRPALAVAPDGHVSVVYYSLTSTGSQMVYAVFADSVRRDFGAPVLLSSQPSSTSVGAMADDGRANFGDQLAAVATNNALLAAWTGTTHDHQAIEFTRLPVAAPGPVVAGRAVSPSVIGALVGVAIAIAAAVTGAWVRSRRRTRL